jgi:hypothetical protein
MSRQRFELPETPLGNCEFWPTTLMLPPGTIRRLDELVRRASGLTLGVQAARGEIVSGLVLSCTLTEPEDLVALSHDVGSLDGDAAIGDPLATRARQRLFVRLPSPVSWRLHRMVARAQLTGDRATRAGIVSGLVHTAPQDNDDLRRLAEDARTCLATAAALPDEDPATVLSLKRPMPGPVARRRNQRPRSPRPDRARPAQPS